MTILELKEKLPPKELWEVINNDTTTFNGYTANPVEQVKPVLWAYITLTSQSIDTILESIKTSIKENESIIEGIMHIISEAFSCKYEPTLLTINGIVDTNDIIDADVKIPILTLLNMLRNNDYNKIKPLFDKLDTSTKFNAEAVKFCQFYKENRDLSKSPSPLILAAMPLTTFEALLTKNESNFFNIFKVDMTKEQKIEYISDLTSILFDYYIENPKDTLIPFIKLEDPNSAS